jgi:alkylation response protein AidB-like acyl-CoA dehydrogenase
MRNAAGERDDVQALNQLRQCIAAKEALEAAMRCGDDAVQLHGGMGMSDELNVGHYFKRINSINVQFGDPTYHLMRYAQQN